LPSPNGRELAEQAAHVAFLFRNHYIAWRSNIMRAEITTIVEEIKQSIALLRRHL
jgi:hypothetical protein